MSFLSQYMNQLQALCVSNNIRSLYAFGSVTNNQFNEQSDIDLVVDIAETDPLIYSDIYFSLKEQLETLFNRPIDLLEQKAIRNPFLKKEIDQTKFLVYGN